MNCKIVYVLDIMPIHVLKTLTVIINIFCYIIYAKPFFIILLFNAN